MLDENKNEVDYGTIEAKDIYNAGKELSKKYGPWKHNKSLYLFESEIAYKFYIKRNNIEWLDNKNMIPL